MALFTLVNTLKPNQQQAEKTVVVSSQARGGTVTPIRAINIAPIKSPTSKAVSGPSTVITIKTSEIAKTLNSASINASLNAALSTTSLHTSPASSTSSNVKMTSRDVDVVSPLSTSGITDVSLNESSHSDETSPGDSASNDAGDDAKFTHSEPWQKAEVWRYFSLTEDAVNGRRTICKLCGKGLSYNVRTTSTMRNHMKKKHPEIVIHNIMKPRRPRMPRTDFLPSYIIGTASTIGNKDSDMTSGVKVKEEPEDGDEDGITSNYIDGILGGKTAPTAAALATHASAKGTTLSQALAQARALPFGRSVLRTIRPAPPKSGAASGHTVTVRTVGSQPQFTVQAPAGAVQPAFPGLTPILTAAPQQTGKVAQGVQIVRQPPPLRPAPKNTVSGRIAIPLTVSGNMVRPLLITPQGGTTSGPQITQTFSLRDVMERQKNASVNVTNAPVATGNKRSAPVRIGPKSPIVISPTPSPDVGDNEEHVEAPTRAKPEFTSWRQRQSADKKELVDRLKDTLFKFCEENLEYSKCLHIRGDVLVIYDDESLSAEFNKHLHGDEISRDNRVRSRNEAARAKALANQNAEEETCQPIIESVTSMAATTPPTRPVAMTTTAQKRAAGLDRILGSWYSRAEDASNESDADADSSGGAHEELADAEWFPPAKKSRVMKRKCAAPTRIIKHSALLPPSEQNTETPSGDSQDEAASLEGEETPEKGPGARVGDGSETRDGGGGAGAETLDRLEGTRGVMPITIAPESDEEEDGEEDVSDNREEREISGAAGNEIEDEMESEEDEDDGDEEDDDDDVLMIDETEKQDKTTEEGNKAQSEEGENGDSATMQKLVNIVNGENSDENSDTVKSSEKGANNKSADNDEQGEGVEEPVVNGNDEVMDSKGSDDDDEFSEDEDEVPEGVEENQEENVEQENTENSEIHENSENGDISENSEVTEKRGRTRSKRDTNDNERDGDEKAEMVNGHASGKDSRTRERSGERNKTPTQFTMTTRKKSVDSRTAEVRKSTEALNTSTSGVKPPPGGKVKVRQEGKAQKTSEKSDSRIAPVERPNTRRLSRRITREDDDFVT